jgi:hypothetical protein
MIYLHKPIRYLRAVSLLISILICGIAYPASDNPFRLASTKDASIQIGKTFNKSGVIRSFGEKRAIYGLSLTGSVDCQSDDYLVRVIMTDEKGGQHLVFESYTGLSESKKIPLDGYCEETSRLDGVIPVSVDVYIRNASITVNDIGVSYSVSKGTRDVLSSDGMRYDQTMAKVAEINKYNVNHNKLWYANATPLSLKSYSLKKRILGMSDDESLYGLEYYAGGIFEMGVPSASLLSSSSAPTSNCIETFDWRNRHGINWVTSQKNQGNSGYCVAFACVSALEALTNLYYNRKIDFDLSEQEVACCCQSERDTTYKHGMAVVSALNYIKDHGVCDEIAYPFVDTITANHCRSDSILPNETVKFHSYYRIGTSDEDAIKRALISNGPLPIGFHSWGTAYHEVCLTGYNVLHAGDTIRENTGVGSAGPVVIADGDYRIGKTVWYMKDSYGLSLDSEHQGYMYMVFNHGTIGMLAPYALNVPITTTSYTDSDIVISDRDGDGYYFWGIGPRPSFCPSYVPTKPDGDDSNSLLGPMDQYGYCENINPNERDTIYIVSNDTISASKNVYNHYVITGTGTLTVRDSMNFYNGSTIRIENGGKLFVNNNAVMNKVDISLDSGASVTLDEGGLIHLLHNKSLSVPLGATVRIENGAIINH